MEYHGKLYGRLGRDFYFDTGKTSEDYDNLVKRVAELEAQLEQKLNIHNVMQGLASRMQDCPPDIAEIVNKNWDKLLDASPSVGKAGEDASVSDGK